MLLQQSAYTPSDPSFSLCVSICRFFSHLQALVRVPGPSCVGCIIRWLTSTFNYSSREMPLASKGTSTYMCLSTHIYNLKNKLYTYVDMYTEYFIINMLEKIKFKIFFYKGNLKGVYGLFLWKLVYLLHDIINCVRKLTPSLRSH